MSSWRAITLIKDPSITFYLKQAALNALYGLYIDYFSEIDFSNFEDEHLYHESVVMKAAAYRFMTPEIQTLLLEAAVQAGCLDKGSHQFHPVFYLRISKPSQNREHGGPLLDSQPHFDRSFGVPATSFWLALENVNMETGGLVFFSDRIHEFSTEWGQSNKYDYDSYLNNSKAIDHLIRNKIIYPSLKSGEAYQFDSDTLHAATKARGGVRMSFDFRVIDRKYCERLDERSMAIFDVVCSNIALANSANLKMLGDEIGAMRYVKKYGLADNFINSVNSITEIKKRKNKMRWRYEYSWIDSNLFHLQAGQM